MYPDLETIRNADNYEKIVPSAGKVSNFERNCNQIFSKGPALTRDILDKIQHVEIAPSRTYLFGRKFKTSQFWIVAGLVLLFLCSCPIIIVMWCTNLFEDFLCSNLVLKEGTQPFELWRQPNVKPLMKFYVFNYTNIEAFENGDDPKLKVEETGPYVYEDTMERRNVIVDGTLLSFQLYHEYRFVPELSKGSQDDLVNVPNVPMLAASALSRYKTYFDRLGLSMLFSSSSAEPFVKNLKVSDFILGYEDDFFTMSKMWLKYNDKKVYEKFGLLIPKMGLQDNIFTIDSGAENIDNIGKIKNINGKTQLKTWSADECNSFEGATDATMFSPKRIQEKQPVKMFLAELGRTFTFEFQKENTIFNKSIPSYRYVLPDSIWDSPDKNPKNKCYWNEEEDSVPGPQQGLFNVTSCSMDVPFFISNPHFYKGDPSLLEGLAGLKPDKRRPGGMSLEIHPVMGFPLTMDSQFQFNIQIMKSFGISQLKKYEDKMFLPLSWFEYSIGEKDLSADMVNIIYTLTYTVKIVEGVLKYGSIIMALVTIIPILIKLKNGIRPAERTNSVRPLQRCDSIESGEN